MPYLIKIQEVVIIQNLNTSRISLAETLEGNCLYWPYRKSTNLSFPGNHGCSKNDEIKVCWSSQYFWYFVEDIHNLHGEENIPSSPVQIFQRAIELIQLKTYKPEVFLWVTNEYALRKNRRTQLKYVWSCGWLGYKKGRKLSIKGEENHFTGECCLQLLWKTIWGLQVN